MCSHANRLTNCAIAMYGIAFGNKNEQTSEMCTNVDESQNHCAKQRSQMQKAKYCIIPLYIAFLNKK